MNGKDYEIISAFKRRFEKASKIIKKRVSGMVYRLKSDKMLQISCFLMSFNVRSLLIISINCAGAERRIEKLHGSCTKKPNRNFQIIIPPPPSPPPPPVRKINK